MFWIILGCTDTASDPGGMSLRSKIDWGGWSQEEYSFAVNYLLRGEREADGVWFIITDIWRKMLQDLFYSVCCHLFLGISIT